MKSFDEELFLGLCKKYGVEVTEGKGDNILLENGIEKVITPEFLLEVLTHLRHDKQLEKEPIVNKGNKTIVLSIHRDNDFTQLLFKGLREFRGQCSGDSDFLRRLQAPNAESLLENICRKIYMEKKGREGAKEILLSSLAYIEVSIDIENRSVEEHKNFYNGWNNFEAILVYVKDGKICMEDF